MSAGTDEQLSNRTLLERTQDKLWEDGLGAARAKTFATCLLSELAEQVDRDAWRKAVEAADREARRPR